MIIHDPDDVVRICIQVLEAENILHTHHTCHPLSMFGMIWISVDRNVFQFRSCSLRGLRRLQSMKAEKAELSGLRKETIWSMADFPFASTVVTTHTFAGSAAPVAWQT